MKKWVLILLLCSLGPAATAGVGSDLAKGSRLYKEQKFGQALSTYQQALQKDPYNQETLFNIGAAHYRLKEYKEAQQAWENASQKQGKRSQDALYNMGNAFYRAQDLDSAIAAYRKAILQNPQDKEAIHNLQIVLEQKEKNQQDSTSQNNKGDPQQNKNNQGGGQNNQQEQQQQQKQQQQDKANSSSMSKEEAQRVAQMAKENEYRPSYASNQGDSEASGIEKDW